MIIGIRDVYYSVTDMRKAVAFYRDVLGLSLIEESSGWSAFDVNGVRLGLHERDPGAPLGAVVTFEVENLDKAIENLRHRGVRFRGAAEHEEFGSLIEFEDAEGNVAKLLEPRRRKLNDNASDG